LNALAVTVNCNVQLGTVFGPRRGWI